MAEHQSREQLIRSTLEAEIATMLDELGNPPLVQDIFPNGWRNANDQKLKELYDLCLRTFSAREKTNAR